jgi:hypothetical protein
MAATTAILTILFGTTGPLHDYDGANIVGCR